MSKHCYYITELTFSVVSQIIPLFFLPGPTSLSHSCEVLVVLWAQTAEQLKQLVFLFELGFEAQSLQGTLHHFWQVDWVSLQTSPAACASHVPFPLGYLPVTDFWILGLWLCHGDSTRIPKHPVRVKVMLTGTGCHYRNIKMGVWRETDISNNKKQFFWIEPWRGKN